MSAPKLTRLPADCSVQDIVAANEQDGGVIVEGWLSGSLLEKFNAELEPWLASHAGWVCKHAGCKGW